MKKLSAITRFAAVAAITTVTFISPAAACKGMNLGLRASYGVPMGTAAEGIDFNKFTTGAVPIQLDATYRIGQNWQAGAYFAWGYARVADEAKADLAAAGITGIDGHREQRVGLQGIYSLNLNGRIRPWVGAGAGYAWTRYAEGKDAAGKETEVGLSGFEGMAQLGADYKASTNFSVGPFAAFNIGQFNKTHVWTDGSDDHTASIKDKGTHEWLQFGVKTTFGM